MLKPIVLEVLAKEYGGSVLNGAYRFYRISTDTRTLSHGDLFVALKGSRFDAHDYLFQALNKGAKGLVINESCNKPLSFADDLAIWLVSDTTSALGFIANYQRRHFQHPVIAITGSSGKTTVKGMLREILSVRAGRERVFATKGNYNNHIGVPLSLLQINQNHRYAVIEMGASGLNEIAYLANMVKPDIALVNNVMAAHVEGFGSTDAIAQEKGKIYEHLSDQGCAIINIGDSYGKQWLSQNKQRKTITFFDGSENQKTKNLNGDVRTVNHYKQKNGCYAFSLVCGQQTTEVKLNVLGIHNTANAAAAAACAFALEIDIQSIREGLENFKNESRRLQLSEGFGGITLIDDTYNSNPGSMKAAIDVLASVPSKKVLVMGDMAELGEKKIEEHEAIGDYIAEKNIDYFLSLGECSKHTNEILAKKNVNTKTGHYQNCDDLIKDLKKWLHKPASQFDNKHCTVLVKGSRSSRMERVIQALQTDGGRDAGLAC